MYDNTLKAVREIAFNYLVKTNRLLIINDKDDSFFHCFDSKYKVCHSLLIGSDYEDIPYYAGYSVTNLGTTIKSVYDDYSLNVPVDVLYIDLTSYINIDKYLEQTIDENTLVVFKLKNQEPVEIPPYFKKYKDTCYRLGDWDEDHKHDSQYFLILI